MSEEYSDHESHYPGELSYSELMKLPRYYKSTERSSILLKEIMKKIKTLSETNNKMGIR